MIYSYFIAKIAKIVFALNLCSVAPIPESHELIERFILHIMLLRLYYDSFIRPMRKLGGLVQGLAVGKILSGMYLRIHKKCRILIPGTDIDSGCRCATSWCDPDLTFDFECQQHRVKNI